MNVTAENTVNPVLTQLPTRVTYERFPTSLDILPTIFTIKARARCRTGVERSVPAQVSTAEESQAPIAEESPVPVHSEPRQRCRREA